MKKKIALTKLKVKSMAIKVEKLQKSLLFGVNGGYTWVG